jgi:hypothetical protein
MRQLLHIFKKDVRGLRGELAVFLVALLSSRLTGTSRAESGDFRSTFGTPVEVMVLMAGAYLIARLIHAEVLADTRQYWLSRPYRWKSLLAAKALFLLSFIHLPVFLSQAALLYAEGFPLLENLSGLLWFQCLMFFSVSLPAAALAAVTSGLVPFIGASIGAVAAWSFFNFLRSAEWVREYVLPISDYYLPSHRQSEWVRTGILLTGVALASLAAVYMQYRHRRVFLSRALLIAIGFAGVFVHSFSANAGFRWSVQSATSKKTLDTSGWVFSLSPASLIHRMPPNPLRGMNLAFTIKVRIDGIPGESFVRFQNTAAVLRASDGESITSNRGDLSQGEMAGGSLALRFYSSNEFFEKIRATGGTLRTRVDLVLFEKGPSVTIPAASFPANVTDSFRCLLQKPRFDQHPDKVTMRCRAALRWPADTLAVDGRLLASQDSYSPFPADLRLDPIIDRGSKTFVSGTKQQFQFTSMKPVSFGRATFEIPNIRLGEPER